LKWVALGLNLIVVLICAGLLWYRVLLDMGADLTNRTTLVFIVAAIHAAYFAFAVTKESVKTAARKYGRELILSTEAIMSPPPTPRTKAK
jgi:hypothetical protein